MPFVGMHENDDMYLTLQRLENYRRWDSFLIELLICAKDTCYFTKFIGTFILIRRE